LPIGFPNTGQQGHPSWNIHFEESHAKDASDISVPNPYIIVNPNTRLLPTEYPNSK